MAAHPLKKFRESHRPPLTQEDLAREIGVEPMTVSRWERGEVAPQRRYWSVIEKITGIKIAKILMFEAA